LYVHNHLHNSNFNTSRILIDTYLISLPPSLLVPEAASRSSSRCFNTMAGGAVGGSVISSIKGRRCGVLSWEFPKDIPLVCDVEMARSFDYDSLSGPVTIINNVC
jgi:hypothetical protein